MINNGGIKSNQFWKTARKIKKPEAENYERMEGQSSTQENRNNTNETTSKNSTG